MTQKYLKLGSILKKLLFDRGIKASDLAREINLPPPTIHRLITGKSTRPYKSSLLPIANYFSITLNQLIGEESIEGEIKNRNENISSIAATLKYIPIQQWGRLDPDCPTFELSSDKLPFVGSISDNGFATIIHDSSMAPIFARGCLLIFDPDIAPRDRCYVLVLLENSSEPIFRQLLIDVDHRYLKPLNPDLHMFKMRLLGLNDKIIGTLLEARQSY